MSSVTDFLFLFLRIRTLGQSICMGHVLSKPLELIEELYSEPCGVFAAMRPHKSILFIYFLRPGEMLLQRGESFFCLNTVGFGCVCVCAIEGAC